MQYLVNWQNKSPLLPINTSLPCLPVPAGLRTYQFLLLFLSWKDLSVCWRNTNVPLRLAGRRWCCVADKVPGFALRLPFPFECRIHWFLQCRWWVLSCRSTLTWWSFYPHRCGPARRLSGPHTYSTISPPRQSFCGTPSSDSLSVYLSLKKVLLRREVPYWRQEYKNSHPIQLKRYSFNYRSRGWYVCA